MNRIEIFGIKIDQQMSPGTDIVRTIVDCSVQEGCGIEENDVIVITSKIVSKVEGRMYKLSDVKVSRKASMLSKFYRIPPEVMQLYLQVGKTMVVVPVERLSNRFGHILEEYATDKLAARSIIREHPYIFLINVKGQPLTWGGIDFSNSPPGYCTLLPEDPDKSARNIREGVKALVHKEVAVVIADSEWKLDKYGTTDIAVGSSGIQPLTKKFADKDLYGQPKFGGVDDMTNLASASANLLLGQTNEGIPLAIIRGLKYEKSEEGIASVFRLNRPYGRTLITLLWETAKFKVLSNLFF